MLEALTLLAFASAILFVFCAIVYATLPEYGSGHGTNQIGNDTSVMDYYLLTTALSGGV